MNVSRLSLPLRAALLVGLVLAVAAAAFVLRPDTRQPVGAPPGVVLTDLHDIGELRARFNADVGSPRLLLLLSPT